jgi:hypothetical protein
MPVPFVLKRICVIAQACVRGVRLDIQNRRRVSVTGEIEPLGDDVLRSGRIGAEHAVKICVVTRYEYVPGDERAKWRDEKEHRCEYASAADQT